MEQKNQISGGGEKWKNQIITLEQKKQLYYELHRISVGPTQDSGTARCHSLVGAHISSVIIHVQRSYNGTNEIIE